jgi:hypothetical protein
MEYVLAAAVPHHRLVKKSIRESRKGTHHTKAVKKSNLISNLHPPTDGLPAG